MLDRSIIDRLFFVIDTADPNKTDQFYQLLKETINGLQLELGIAHADINYLRDKVKDPKSGDYGLLFNPAATWDRVNGDINELKKGLGILIKRQDKFEQSLDSLAEKIIYYIANQELKTG